MGQYQQWLFAQEVERRLKAEIETLETELLYLGDRITILEQAAPETENVILQALLAHLQGRASQEESADWPGLPRVETPRGGSAQSYAPEFYSEMNKDMLAFFDEREQADAKGAARSPHNYGGFEEEEHLVDEETRRLNENIQRWFTRWRRRIIGAEQAEGMQHE